MARWITLPLILASLVSGAVLEPRQGLFGGVGEKADPIKIEDVKPRIRSEAKRQFIRYGPLTLPPSKDGGASAGQSHGHGGMNMGSSGAPRPNITSILSGGLSMDPNGFAFSRSLTSGYCQDCTVLAAKIDVVFENGTRADIANGVYLHHVVTSMSNKSQKSWVSFCPGNISLSIPGINLDSLRGGTGFVGGAVDEFTDYFTTPDGKFDSGYYIPKTSKASMSGEIINYLREEQKVFIRLDMEWLPGKVGSDAVKTPLSVEGCSLNSQAFKNGPKGKVVSDDFIIGQDGNIICMRGHMHDGGDAVIAYVNNQKVCESKATYGLAGGRLVVEGKEWKTISKMSECTQPIAVQKGDKLRLEATYDNIDHPPRKSNGQDQENMGFMQLTFVGK